MFRDFVGNPDYYENDNISLLRISDDDDNSHYIYIKNISHLLKLSYQRKDTDNVCPYCNKCFDCFNFSDHIKQCYKIQFNDSSLIKLTENQKTTCTRSN